MVTIATAVTTSASATEREQVRTVINLIAGIRDFRKDAISGNPKPQSSKN
jgi:hypothetical protein